MTLTAAELESCYRRLEQPLYNVLYRWLWDRQSCQDLLHDSFMRVWAQRQRVRADGLDALVWTTALNLARNRLRWQRLRHWVGLEAQTLSADVDPGSDPALQIAQLRDALAQLSGSDRELLLLSEFSGLSTRELAQVLRIAEGTVGSRRHRAVQRLRTLMGADDEN